MLLEVSWTDTVQAIAAAIAVPGSIWALVLLLKRDKARESEIQSLSQIAYQLTNMLKASEARHKSSKKPQITVKVSDQYPIRTIRCDFKNSNIQTNILSYKVLTDSLEEITPSKTTITDDNGTQYFYIDFNYSDKKPEWIVIYMDYETEEGYVFIQDITLIQNQNDNYNYRINSGVIMDKENSPLKK